jgi:ubiquinone/menaquinone biosynthesis C-methylase UbiE
MPLLALTERQARELAYHQDRALRLAQLIDEPVSLDVVTSSNRHWWNPYWCVYSLLRNASIAGKKALVLGCGFGEDAIRLSSLGMDVCACDLCSDSVAIATARARKTVRSECIHFQVMPAEKLTYGDDAFDLILAVDIFHHVDIPATLLELHRVAKPNCVLLCLEMYTHSWLTSIRESRLVSRFLYPAMVQWIYGSNRPYITADERKLNEKEITLIADSLSSARTDWFYAIINRLVPDRFTALEICDRIAIKLLGPFGSIVAGRVILRGQIPK